MRKNKHHSIKLQRAWNKHGEQNFEFEILELVLPDILLDIENKYLKKLKPFYNTALDAHAPMAGRKHSENAKKKFRSWKRPKGKDHHLYGKKLSPETIKAMILAHTGSKRNDETKAKMRETAIRINAISRVNRDNQKEKVYDSLGNRFMSMAECAKFWEVSVQTVCDILKGRHYKTRAKVSFYYLHDEDIYAP